MMTSEKREAIRARLAELEAAGGGRLTPDAVVEEAKRKDSVLHDQFEWDVKKAAQAQWISQARTLITSVMVLHRTEKTIVKSVYYVRDPSLTARDQGYVSVPTLRTNEDLARHALVDAFSAAGDMLRKARELAVVLDLDGDVDALINGVVELRGRVMAQPVQEM